MQVFETNSELYPIWLMGVLYTLKCIKNITTTYVNYNDIR